MSEPLSSGSSQRDSRTSRYLLALARSGDSGALNRLFARYLPKLRRWTHGRLPHWARSGRDTSDLVQDALLQTIPRLGAFEGRGKDALGRYLRTAVRNRIRDEHRGVSRRGVPERLSDETVDQSLSPLDVAIAHEMELQYRRALELLSPDDRELVVGHVELDYTHQQLGYMTGRSPNAARMALHRAVQRLAERMRDA